MRRVWPCMAAIGIALGSPAGRFVHAQSDPYQIEEFCTPYPNNTRTPIIVTNGSELQQALDNAVAGDTIKLAAGASFQPVAPEGSFMLRNAIAANQWVIIRSDNPAFDVGGSIPPNTRVDSSNAGLMPLIRATANNTPAFRTAAGARGYRLVGLDIGMTASVTLMSALVDLGSATATSTAGLASDIVVDRCYIHANDIGEFRRGVAFNGSTLAVIESYISNFHATEDAQAIAGWNGPGPYKIVNNFLEATGETIIFGGSDPAITNMVAQNIEVRRNYCTRRLAWKTAGLAVKNAFELKAARLVLVEGNMFENVWSSGQDGTAILFKSANQNGGCTLCVTEYVTFRNNVVRNAGSGLKINAAEVGGGVDPSLMPPHANHIRVQNILFENIDPSQWGGAGKLFAVYGGAPSVEMTHVTSISNPGMILEPASTTDNNPDLTFKYNLVERKFYGIGTGANEAFNTLNQNFTPHVYNDNVLVNNSDGTDQQIADADLQARYPAITWVASDWTAVKFQQGTYKLCSDAVPAPPGCTSASPYYRAGDDGKDIGVDMDAIAAAQSGPGGSEGSACGGPPPSTAPEVVIDASDLATSVVHGAWTRVADASAAGGAKLWTPDLGVSNISAPLASPIDYFDVTFDAHAGADYTIWLRLKADANSKWNDSVWVQFSDALVDGVGKYQIGSGNGLLVNLATDANATNLNGWGWQNTAYWFTQATTVRFAANGPHTMRVQVREDGVAIDQIVLSPNQYLSSSPGPTGGDATIVIKPLIDVVTYGTDVTTLNGTWTRVADATAAGSSRLSTSDAGVSNTSAALASPVDYFDVTVQAQAGMDYTVWLRLQAEANSKWNDSVWVQFADAFVSGAPAYQIGTTDGLLVNLATDFNATNLNAWGWQNTEYWFAQATTVRFATTGSHTIRVQVREDGVSLDQIVLSPSRYLTSPPGPTGGDGTIVPKP